MTEQNSLKAAFRDTEPLSRREIRAARTRARALSPVRILLSLLLVPVVAAGMTGSIYIRTSPFEPEDTLRHLAALTGCPAAEKFGVPRASRGNPGYHLRNDADGDGVACNENDSDFAAAEFSPDIAAHSPAPVDPARQSGGAKFVRP